MSIEAAVRAMLTAGTTLSGGSVPVPDERVTHGFRLQSTLLPAVTFEVNSIEPASISSTGSTSAGTRMAGLEVRSIAVEAVDAIAVAERVRTACVRGTYSGYNLDAVLYQGHRVEAQAAGEGDESQPAEAVSTITIYYRE
jgi:hypothetical protein